jgi:hypothetical protein
MGTEDSKEEKKEQKTSIFSCGPGRTNADGSKAKKAQDRHRQRTEKDYEKILQNSLAKRNKEFN